MLANDTTDLTAGLPNTPLEKDTLNEDIPRSSAVVLGPQFATTSVAVTTAETRRKQSTRPEDAATHEAQAVDTQVHDAVSYLQESFSQPDNQQHPQPLNHVDDKLSP